MHPDILKYRTRFRRYLNLANWNLVHGHSYAIQYNGMVMLFARAFQHPYTDNRTLTWMYAHILEFSS